VTANAFLDRIVALLDTASIPYMVCGSFASTYHGVPRATQDLDRGYIRRWAAELGVLEAWERAADTS
jgi:hypothetical protein